MSSALSTQVGFLIRRSMLRTLRQPAAVIPSITFPLILFGINAGGLAAAAQIPGFPADSYLDFIFAFPFIQGALFGATMAGGDLARDIETGFLNRLSLTPVSRVALLAGLMCGVVGLALLQGLVFVTVGVLAGVQFAAGVGGVAVMLVLMALTALGFGGLGAWLAVRTGSGEAVQGAFPLFFVAIFLSSVNLPRELIAVDWFRAVATWNPVSYLIEGMRSLVITGWDPTALALAFAVAAALVVIGLTAAAAGMRTRLGRT